jgi:hypothetical protein
MSLNSVGLHGLLRGGSFSFEYLRSLRRPWGPVIADNRPNEEMCVFMYVYY